jgi:hypothetical protein
MHRCARQQRRGTAGHPVLVAAEEGSAQGVAALPGMLKTPLASRPGATTRRFDCPKSGAATRGVWLSPGSASAGAAPVAAASTSASSSQEKASIQRRARPRLIARLCHPFPRIRIGRV